MAGKGLDDAVLCCFTDTKRLVGDAAKNQMIDRASNSYASWLGGREAIDIQSLLVQEKVTQQALKGKKEKITLNEHEGFPARMAHLEESLKKKRCRKALVKGCLARRRRKYF